MRSTASRTASGTRCGVVLRFAIAKVSHIVAPIQVPIHLNPQAELAQRVLLPGDPHRALAIAQALLDSPRMFNTRRGLWGYSGRAPDGELLTVQATGMGGPSAAIVIEELIALGASTLIRVGTCGALDGDLSLGQVVAVVEAISADGTSGMLSPDSRRLEPDGGITDALLAGGATGVSAVSTDLFYDPDPARADGYRATGAQVIEMECATLFALAPRLGARAACVRGVSDLLLGERRRIEDEPLEALGVRLGEAGLAALLS
ncbi:MAG: purine-nucleoside phosphorylase [Thermoleophilaceae bacterium]